MDDTRAAHQEERASDGVAGRLLIVVPPCLPSRINYFTGMLAGSGIDVIVDRRQAVRRRRPVPLADDRRHRDRRGYRQPFGYLYGCSIVRVGPLTSR